MSFARPDDMVREWLEKIYALAGPGADMAKAALDEWDALADTEFDEENALIEMVENHGVPQIYDSYGAIGRGLTKLEEIRALLEEAELIDAGDRETDPVPLLEMFLPVV